MNMGRYDKKNGYYPNHKQNTDLKNKIDDTLEVISFMLDKNIRESRLRVLTNDVFEYLEQYEDFHYGVSTEANKLTVLNSKTVVLEHAIPSNLIIKELKKQKPEKHQLLDFFRKHYYLCLITIDENKRLDKGLRKKMPDHWKENWNDWQCRYREKDIKLIIQPGNL